MDIDIKILIFVLHLNNIWIIIYTTITVLCTMYIMIYSDVAS